MYINFGWFLPYGTYMMGLTFSCQDDAQQLGDHANSMAIRINPNMVRQPVTELLWVAAMLWWSTTTSFLLLFFKKKNSQRPLLWNRVSFDLQVPTLVSMISSKTGQHNPHSICASWAGTSFHPPISDDAMSHSFGPPPHTYTLERTRTFFFRWTHDDDIGTERESGVFVCANVSCVLIVVVGEKTGTTTHWNEFQMVWWWWRREKNTQNGYMIENAVQLEAVTNHQRDTRLQTEVRPPLLSRVYPYGSFGREQGGG